MAELGIVKNTEATTKNAVTRREVITNPGGDPNVTGDQYLPPGVDAHPLPGDFAALMPTPRTGSRVVVGNLDTKNPPKAAPGEHRVYARDAAGAIVSEAWHYTDGKIIISNANATFTISPDGTIEAANAGATFTLSPDGTIEALNDLVALTLHPDGKAELINPAASLTMETSGEIAAENAGHIKLLSSGVVDINGTTFDIAGNVVIPLSVSAPLVTATISLIAALKELVGHAHTSGLVGQPTGPNL